jgi:hypothetical protein
VLDVLFVSDGLLSAISVGIVGVSALTATILRTVLRSIDPSTRDERRSLADEFFQNETQGFEAAKNVVQRDLGCGGLLVIRAGAAHGVPFFHTFSRIADSLGS